MTCCHRSKTGITYTLVGSGASTAFGQYVLLRKVRMQGAVEVHLGVLRSAGGVERLVIVKRLGREVAQERGLAEELLEEARIAGQLAHVNIAQVLDVGEDDEGGFYFAMEHVHGKSLRTVLDALAERGSVLPVEHALHIAIQLCSALSHAHEHKDLRDDTHNVIHGALSPENVFVTFAGDVKVTDFGLLASKNWVKDTIPIAYMAPEQAKEELPDPRTDLYALGMLMLELTTGKAPLYRPPEFAPGYPPKLAAILLQAAARRRTHRHQSAIDLLAQLEMFAGKGGLRISPAVFASYLRDIFPDADAELVRDRREAKVVVAVRKEARTIPDAWPPAATPANVTLELPPTHASPDALEDLEAGLRSAGLHPLTSAPPAVRTWRPRVDSNRYAVMGGAVALGVVIGFVGHSFKRPPSLPAWLASPAPSPFAAASSPSAAASSSSAAASSAPLVDPRQHGSLDVQSEPAGANVFVEGELMADVTPATLERLPLGRPLHVRVGRSGFETFQAEVTLSTERPREQLLARLAPAMVTLRLVIDVPDAALWVDGKFTTARTIAGLAADQDHRIAVSAPGRIGKIVVFRSEQGGEKRLVLKLDPVRSSRSRLVEGTGTDEN